MAHTIFVLNGQTIIDAATLDQWQQRSPAELVDLLDPRNTRRQPAMIAAAVALTDAVTSQRQYSHINLETGDHGWTLKVEHDHPRP